MGLLDVLRSLGGGEGDAPDDSAAGTETVRKIVDELDQLDPDRARYVAAFAYLLSRVAHADLQISKDETRAMERIVMERGDLPEDQAIIVVQMAKTQSLLFGGTEDYLVTREFAELASHDQKLRLLDCLYAVSAVDEGVSTVEDNEIKKIANEIKLARADVVAVRSRYREHLSVLKPGDPS